MLTSIVIRTFNEQKYLGQLLESISIQKLNSTELEIVIVDSGSTDATLKIAQDYGCRVTNIKQEEFTFGRSLNYGCDFANGEILVFISGHCIPIGDRWLENLIRPLAGEISSYTYGRQLAHEESKFSEKRHFEKWFPSVSKIPQEGYYCNNANAAIRRASWEQTRFNEELTGLEDMCLAKHLVNKGGKVAYIADACVHHIHEESWAQIKKRYERESIALQVIMPEVHFNGLDFFRCYFKSIFSDLSAAAHEGVFLTKFGEILAFRLMQYWGTYCGNQEHRKLSEQQKRSYYYPGNSEN